MPALLFFTSPDLIFVAMYLLFQYGLLFLLLLLVLLLPVASSESSTMPAVIVLPEELRDSITVLRDKGVSHPGEVVAKVSTATPKLPLAPTLATPGPTGEGEGEGGAGDGEAFLIAKVERGQGGGEVGGAFSVRLCSALLFSSLLFSSLLCSICA